MWKPTTCYVIEGAHAGPRAQSRCDTGAKGPGSKLAGAGRSVKFLLQPLSYRIHEHVLIAVHEDRRIWWAHDLTLDGGSYKHPAASLRSTTGMSGVHSTGGPSSTVTVAPQVVAGRWESGFLLQQLRLCHANLTTMSCCSQRPSHCGWCPAERRRCVFMVAAFQQEHPAPNS